MNADHAPRLRLLGRPDCGLCEELAAALHPWQQRGELRLEWHEVDSRPDWQRRYGLRIPVLLDDWDQTVCEGCLDPASLAHWLSDPRRT